MGICCMTQGTQTGTLWWPRGWDGVGGRDICISMADSCWCMVKSIQYCKAIILQLKLNKIFLMKHCFLNIILHCKEAALFRRMPGFKTEAEKKWDEPRTSYSAKKWESS